MKSYGLSKVDLLVIAAVLAVLVALGAPSLLAMREAARARVCQKNLQQIGIALQTYHDAFKSLPPAAYWRTDRMQSLALHDSHRIDLFVGANWMQLVLPQLGEDRLAAEFDREQPIADRANSVARATRIRAFNCPSDSFNNDENAYEFQIDSPSVGPLRFARGNYAINGGSQNHRLHPGTSAYPVGDGSHVLMDRPTRTYEYWGNGVAGINVSFSFDDFANGLSTTVVVDEIRSGIHAIDPRGAWALGLIGSSITWSHGINGDDGGPNNQWERSDDLLFGGKLHAAVGYDTLMREEMPCVWYVDVSQQATARSRHENGVHVLFADGRANFIRNDVEPGLWHAIHSRETPSEVLGDGLPQHLAVTNYPEKPSLPRPLVPVDELPSQLANSIGMKFVLIPAGPFTMAVPDDGNDADLPQESPSHPVRITQPFYLGIHEVTQAQFQIVTQQRPSWHNDATAEQSDFPVEQVTWEQAADFCRSLSERTAEQSAGRTYRLPTEAEWEYACRSGQSAAYSWKRERQADDNTGENAGLRPPLPLAAVGSSPANAFGLHDMRGNVWEWTADWFDRDYYARSPVDDPQGPAMGYLKVVRGGDWTFIGETCRINYPTTPPWKSSRFIGFRVVCEINRPTVKK